MIDFINVALWVLGLLIIGPLVAVAFVKYMIYLCDRFIP